jgi:hypothetical protein
MIRASRFAGVSSILTIVRLSERSGPVSALSTLADGFQARGEDGMNDVTRALPATISKQ